MINKSIIGLAIISITFACGNKNEEKKENTTPNVATHKMGELKIAYYDQDSMKAQFLYYKEQDSIVTKKQLAFQKSLEKKQGEMQSYYNNFMKRAQNGELSQVETEGYQRNLQAQEAQLMQYQESEGGKIEKETIEKLEAIGKKIEQFSKLYCEENGIDILMIYAKGGQFNYIHPSMDVTKEFTAYLNEQQDKIKQDLQKK